tara:strand:- start:1853 stop:2446 length:594 start_codon:yes stop_codon:yes gene_type:complete
MKQLFFIGILFVLLSCGTQETQKASQEDYLVLNTVFPNLVVKSPPGTKDTWAPNNFKKVDTVKFKNLIEEVYFINYLAHTKDSSFTHQIDSTYKSNLESNHKQLLRQLLTKQNNIPLELKKITNVGFYKIISFKNQKLDIGKPFLCFSNIIYNKNKTEACFYFENNCNGMCSSGELIFLKKIKGNWEPVKRLEIWVS